MEASKCQGRLAALLSRRKLQLGQTRGDGGGGGGRRLLKLLSFTAYLALMGEGLLGLPRESGSSEPIRVQRGSRSGLSLGDHLPSMDSAQEHSKSSLRVSGKSVHAQRGLIGQLTHIRLGKGSTP